MEASNTLDLVCHTEVKLKHNILHDCNLKSKHNVALLKLPETAYYTVICEFHLLWYRDNHILYRGGKKIAGRIKTKHKTINNNCTVREGIFGLRARPVFLRHLLDCENSRNGPYFTLTR